ncbi:thiol:disulfide interchange protein DsbA/DsbL [Solimonas variicoloris]|uniref:thiol:disulfide interchange protein DsbA/DsbL n=1 Tax=Solimonas variicoloris TaxID=254408 RepID=UPI00039B57BD|nr:thiol:disulfide interchange protein DsbA/DsbL [Solimonas variicoloris]
MRHAFRGLIAVALSLSAIACSAAEPPKFEAGKQYKAVRTVQAPADPKRIEVAEFFWYGCPHCYAFEPTLADWEKNKPADVAFVRYPNTLGHPLGLLHSKAYYTAEALNVLPKMHTVLFDALHRDNIPLGSEAQIAALFQRAAGTTPEAFSGTFNGFVVDAQVRNAENLARAYGVTSTPTLVIGGKYMTGPAMAGGLDPTVQVVNFLIDKVRKERGIKK